MSERRSCIKCKYYRIADDDMRGRTSFDYCEKKGQLPTAAFCFDDTCCSGSGQTYSTFSFACLEEI
ncbi:MAG: hypothetical protein ACXQTX_05025, partial [Candidatus Syntropharchaeia archaeon]